MFKEAATFIPSHGTTDPKRRNWRKPSLGLHMSLIREYNTGNLNDKLLLPGVLSGSRGSVASRH